MRVHRNIVPAGIAIRKLNDTAAALSLMPTLFICAAKNITTSYSGTPSKPGKIMCLLLCLTYLATELFTIADSILFIYFFPGSLLFLLFLHVESLLVFACVFQMFLVVRCEHMTFGKIFFCNKEKII